MIADRLSQYTVRDLEKSRMIETILHPPEYDCVHDDVILELHRIEIECTKFCPECGRKYPEWENFCMDCMVKLKKLRDVNVRDIQVTPQFKVLKTNQWNDFNDILTAENMAIIEEFDFNISDFNKIIKNIIKDVLKTFNSAVKDNDIHLDSLEIEDKILLFSKSFVNVDYKSYGAELGYFEFNKIYIDDRQLAGLQITTLIHELSHFILAEIISQILCELLDCSKTSQIESIAIFILSYSPCNQLIDEYAAHTVEGRFTLFGYQDYSSFLNIQKTINLADEEIEMLKTIGNTFADQIKRILEVYIDYELLSDIKDQLRRDVMDRPDYKNLALENCTLLNDTGLIRALEMIVVDGFSYAMENIRTLQEYSTHWK